MLSALEIMAIHQAMEDVKYTQITVRHSRGRISDTRSLIRISRTSTRFTTVYAARWPGRSIKLPEPSGSDVPPIFQGPDTGQQPPLRYNLQDLHDIEAPPAG